MLHQPVRTASGPSFSHLTTMLTPAGIVQFCRGANPDRDSGTCVDDNARALIVAIAALRADSGDRSALAIGEAAANHLVAAQRSDGLFHNVADIDGRFLDEIGSEDAFGRAVWAWGVALRCAIVPEWRAAAYAALTRSLPAMGAVRSAQARAYVIIGLGAAIDPEAAACVKIHAGYETAPQVNALYDELESLGLALHEEFLAKASRDWSWWLPELSWGNGRLPHALLVAAAVTQRRQFADTGLRALEFLAGITQPADVFIPIGNEGWYPRGGVRAMYDQQPIEACAMADAWLAAYRLTEDTAYRNAAHTAAAWFDGRNTEGLALGVPQTGACYDGLRRGSVNVNQGAESALSYLHASLAIAANGG